MMIDHDASRELRYGWTTGACACACASGAFVGLITNQIPNRIDIALPKERTAQFALINSGVYHHTAHATTIKDAGDDPDVTHGARITVHLRKIDEEGPIFLAGPGVGHITKPGLPLDIGEGAINPKPRAMIGDNLKRLADLHGVPAQMARQLAITISVANGAKIARKTWNPRLGIVG
ncbi:MAG: cobalt-precorrin-5B (C(1))-methyltransferase, partial [Pseudomonadota bacterium]